jgi:hypothetical protein
MAVFRIAVVAIIIAVAHPIQAQIAGTVLDSKSGRPIMGALVSVQAQPIQTRSGQEGEFLLSVEGDNLVIVAANKGYFNGRLTLSAPHATAVIQLDRVSLVDDPDYRFVRPGACGTCHSNQLTHWRDSPMARTGNNPWVYDLFSGDGTPGGQTGFVYTRDSRLAQSDPASTCAACHQPERWASAPGVPLDAAGSQSEQALHGVSCDICHKVAHIDESRTDSPGVSADAVTLTRPSRFGDQVQYGVLGDATYDEFPDVMRPSYQPQLTAAMCAACHQHRVAAVDGVVNQPTYAEWLASDYGYRASPHYATCVDCHMPSYGATEACGFRGYIPPTRDSSTIRHHAIEGTTPHFLQNAVSLRIDARLENELLTADVTVLNDKTGHHVPDGTIRNMILLVTARRLEDLEDLAYQGKQFVHDLGGVGDPAQGYFAGLPGKLYGRVIHDQQGNAPVLFTEAVGVLWDNRIAALAADSSRYTFAVPPGEGTYEVIARLIYRRAFRFLVDDKGWTQDGHGRPLEDLQPPNFGHLMEQATWRSSPATAVLSTAALPEDFRLLGNHPNPFNPTTTIDYELPRDALVILKVFDILGHEVKTLVRGYRAAGRWSVAWDGTDQRGRRVGSGVLLYQLRAGGRTETRKMLLLP